jgi:thioredoxin 1
MHFGLIIQESHGFNRAECQIKKGTYTFAAYVYTIRGNYRLSRSWLQLGAELFISFPAPVYWLKYERGENMGKVLSVDRQTFQTEVMNASIPVLVDFWAPWCGPCRMVAPVMEELAAELTDKLKVVKINVDENADLASQYNVMSIPSIMLFKNGQVVEQMMGFMPKGTIATKIQGHL